MNFKQVLVLVVLVLALGNARLITTKLMKQMEAKGLNVKGNVLKENSNGTIEIPETTCNVVDPTPILPKGQSAKDFVTRSGFLKMGKGNSAFGFIFWGSQAAKGDESKLKDYPTMVWLQGGPGGSSQFGDFTEMGPIIVTGSDNKFTYTYNPYSWNQEYNIIFIDNPIGTGLSPAENILDIPRNQAEVATDLYNGLIELYTAKNGCFNLLGLQESPLVISGESYAGKYVPSIALHILEKDDNDILKKALKGIAVGDGFTDPKTIMTTLPDFGYNLAMLNKQETEVSNLTAFGGVQEMVIGKWLSAKQAFDQVMGDLTELSGLQNVYNWADTKNGPEPLDNLTDWLNQTSIKTDVFQFPEQLNFSEFSGPVYLVLSNDFMKYDVVDSVKKILKKDFPVLFYNGQNDVIVCTPCTEVWLDQVKYSGKAEFKKAAFTVWETEIDGISKVSGYYKQADNLAFVTVNQAGHMVPSDQPEAAYNMITEFVNYVSQRDQVEDKKDFDNNFGMFKMSQRKSIKIQKEKIEKIEIDL